MKRLTVPILGVAVLALGAHAVYLQFFKLPHESGSKVTAASIPNVPARPDAADTVERVNTPITREESDKQWQVHMARVEAEFRKEAKDATWSKTALAKVKSVLASKKVLADRIGSIECRSRTCRIEITDDGAGQVRAELPLLILDWSDMLAGMQENLVKSADGGTTHVLYATRNAPS